MDTSNHAIPPLSAGEAINATPEAFGLPAFRADEPAQDAVFQSTLKRKASPTSGNESEEKRQRTATAEPDLSAQPDLSFMEMLAAASAKTEEALQEDTAPDSDPPIKDEDASDTEKPIRNEKKRDVFTQRQSLPVLKSVSTSLLEALSKETYIETVSMISYPSNELHQSFNTLKTFFDNTKELYCDRDEFVCAADLGLTEPEETSILREANIAAWAYAVFSGKDIDFHSLNNHFIEVFIAAGGELEEDTGLLLLGLKTQLYLAAFSQEEPETKDATLDSIFPANFGARFLECHPEKEITLCESKFLTELDKRRELFHKEGTEAEKLASLAIRFSWEDYLTLVAAYLTKRYKPAGPPQNGQSNYPYLAQENARNGAVGIKQEPRGDDSMIDLLQDINNATAAALATFGGSHDGLPNPSHAMNQFYVGPTGYQQSAPTQHLYEQARRASTNKSTPQTRRPGLPSQRKPWTQDEETALMHGLDQVRGPHWSNILALYGKDGTISEILKDRNQVQLKDKARNLKLFFLKSNIEVPFYLSQVTGELKTRAPSLAQRKEAEERARAAAGPNGHHPGYQHPQFYQPQQQQQQQQQQQAHQAPYPHAPYQQLPPPQPQPQPQPHLQSQPMHSHEKENSSGSSQPEILDPVGPTADIKPEAQVPAASPHAPLPADTAAVQQAVQEMSADEHALVSKLRGEVNGHNPAVDSSTTL